MKLLHMGDFHSGSSLGLTPPQWIPPWAEGWLLPLWTYYTSTIEQIGKVDGVIFNGDLVDGPGEKESAEHLTTNTNYQVQMAIESVRQIRTRERYFVKGTGFHTDRNGNLEEQIACEFNRDALDELRLEVYGRRFHFRHVVGRSDTPYGQYTQIAKEVINELLQSEFEDYEGADYLGRSHVHYTAGVWTYDVGRGVRREAWTAPGLQLRGPKQNGYTRKLRTWLYHVGMTLIEIERGEDPVIRPIIFPIKLYAPKEYQCLTE